MISAIVLAAGQSTRMGQQKMLLPWGHNTIIGKVVFTLIEAGIYDINLVTGRFHDALKNALKGYNINFIFNKNFGNGEMLTSLQVGLRNMREESEAALIVLGDQPQIESRVVQAIVDNYASTHHGIIVPSYEMHRGHPWLIEKSFWNEILELLPPNTMRNFLYTNSKAIGYLNVDTPSVIQDLDTINDYLHYKP